MNVAFVLSMPGVASWNGHWSGEGKLYAVVRNYGASKKAAEKYSALARKSYHYRWDDGWCARVDVKVLASAAEARQMRKHTKGFCGYEWMIDSILDHGAIYASHEGPRAKPIPVTPQPEAVADHEDASKQYSP